MQEKRRGGWVPKRDDSRLGSLQGGGDVICPVLRGRGNGCLFCSVEKRLAWPEREEPATSGWAVLNGRAVTTGPSCRLWAVFQGVRPMNRLLSPPKSSYVPQILGHRGGRNERYRTLNRLFVLL